MSQEKKCYCPCTVSDLCTCQKCIVGFHMPSPIVEEKPYNTYDHFHCWTDKNPPCGQKIKHYQCCLCKELHPEISQTLAEERERIVEIVDKHHAEELAELEASNNQTNTKNIITAGLDIYKRKLINIIKNNK